MPDLSPTAVLIAGVVATTLAGPIIGTAVLVWHRRRARAMRRSPIGIAMLRSPGHTLRQQIDEAMEELTWRLVSLMLIPMALLIFFIGRSPGRSAESLIVLAATIVVAALGVIGRQIHRLMKTTHRLDALRAGFDAELAVGQELDRLMRQGAVVFHDFPADRFNIDHVVVSRRGVFAVETKGYSKPGDLRGKAGATVVFDGQSLAFPRWTTREPIEQAGRQAKWLADWLKTATGEAVGALPVVALPGWYVERKGRGAVRVFSGRELEGLLGTVGATALSEEAMTRVVHQVEQRCRDVVPSYRAG